MNLVLVGAGGIGQYHSRLYDRIPDLVVTAVVDIREEFARKVADKFGAKVYTSFDEMLAHEKPGMVDICTPSYLHAGMAIRCMDKGIHVLCEKPMAINDHDAIQMVAAARRNGVFHMVAHVIRFWPEYVYLKQAYDAGTYGKLRQVCFSRVCGTPFFSWENWFLDPKRSGRVPYDLHIHDADFICYMLGRPEAVSSVAMDDEPAYLSYIKTRYVYKSDVLVEAEGGWFYSCLPFSATYRAVFDRGVLEYRDNKVVFYPPKAEPKSIDLGVELAQDSTINLNSVGGYLNEISYFVDCIRNNTQPQVVTAEDACFSVKLITKELESARRGRKIRL
jgi:predicted dehydrogenase